MPVAEGVDPGNLQLALTTMANEFSAAAGLRIRRFDEIGADSASMWAIAMTSPTVTAALGIRTATESGSGRTRLEANRPVETGAAGGP